jgi:hypothetical protein
MVCQFAPPGIGYLRKAPQKVRGDVHDSQLGLPNRKVLKGNNREGRRKPPEGDGFEGAFSPIIPNIQALHLRQKLG